MAGPAWSNQAIKELVIPTGATSGARIDIGGAGDVILVYDSLGRLIASISPVNQIIGGISLNQGFGTYDPVFPQINARLVGNQLQLIDSHIVPSATPSLVASNNSASVGGGIVGLALESGSVGGNSMCILQLLSESADTTAPPSAIITQRGIRGTVVQTDTGTPSSANIVHIAQYGVTYAVAGNAQTFNHGCGFTPAGCIVSFDDGSAINNASVNIAAGGLTATTASLYTVYQPGGAAPGAGDLVIIQAMFWA